MTVTTWRVCWVDKHEADLITDRSPELQRGDIWAQLRDLGITEDQVTAFYEYSVDNR